nr:hypothetical protein [Tanacetum cinerariifolium]
MKIKPRASLAGIEGRSKGGDDVGNGIGKSGGVPNGGVSDRCGGSGSGWEVDGDSALNWIISDLEEDPKEEDDEDLEEDLGDYPTDKDDDDEEEETSRDDADNEEEDEGEDEEEEEH